MDIGTVSGHNQRIHAAIGETGIHSADKISLRTKYPCTAAVLYESREMTRALISSRSASVVVRGHSELGAESHWEARLSDIDHHVSLLNR